MTNSTSQEAKRAMLRHTIATLAYRGGKTITNPPQGFTRSASVNQRELRQRYWRISVICLTGRSGKPKDSTSGTPRVRYPGRKRSPDFSPRSSNSIHSWLPMRRSDTTPKRYSRGRLPMRSHTSDKLRCCAGWQARQCAEKITSRRKSLRAGWGRSSPSPSGV